MGRFVGEEVNVGGCGGPERLRCGRVVNIRFILWVGCGLDEFKRG